MDSVLTSDIFFFVTTCAVILLTACVAVVLFHVIRLIRTIRSIADRLSNNMSSLETYLRGLPFFSFLFRQAETKKSRRKQKKKETIVE